MNIHVHNMDGLGMGSFGMRMMGVTAPAGIDGIDGYKRGGVGAVPCPSTEQLQGISDPTDPCQAANLIGAIAAGTASQTATDPGMSVSVGGLSTTTLMMIGLGLVALVILSGKR